MRIVDHHVVNDGPTDGFSIDSHILFNGALVPPSGYLSPSVSTLSDLCSFYLDRPLNVSTRYYKDSLLLSAFGQSAVSPARFSVSPLLSSPIVPDHSSIWHKPPNLPILD